MTGPDSTNASTSASTIVLIGTGGTIASRVGATGVATVTGGLPDVLGQPIGTNAPALRVVDLFAVDSAAMTMAQLDRIDAEIRRATSDPSVVGVVVSHGTDSMEETAMLVDLHHSAPAAVVFTGAQRTADHPEADGAANLALALATAGERTRGGRVWIAFGGKVFPVPGTTKIDTAELDGFGPLRSAGHGPRRHTTLPARPIADVIVDVVTLHVGAGDRAIRAALAAGVDGLVIVALGGGNAHPDIVPAIAEATAGGIPVALTSRTPFGAITTAYGGGGGGHDLAAAGAIPTGILRASQARIALAAAIAAYRDHGGTERVRAAFADICRESAPDALDRTSGTQLTS